jgi:hypothetical protein
LISTQGAIVNLGKTVESYRLVVEGEILIWSGFGRALRIEEREAFETLMDAYRGYASAAGNATNPILFETMAMSIMLHQQMCLNKLRKEFDAHKQQPSH